MAWWQWLLIIIGLVLALAGYVIYRGYQKVKPKPINGIPCPPLTHQVLGHPDKMLHPLKHEMRLEVCESARAAVHQLVVMNHASIFVNHADEAGRILEECTSKGRIYSAFRFDAEIPDMLACDGETFTVRNKALGPALRSLQMGTNTSEWTDLISVMNKSASSGETLDVKALYTLFSFDCVCEAAFGFKLDAVNGSEDGIAITNSLKTLSDVQAGTGLYPSPNARKVEPEEIQTAKTNWRGFLNKLLTHIQKDANAYKIQHETLDSERNYGHALVQMSEDNADFTEKEMLSEIHQVLRHGHESIGGTLCWLTYVIYKVADVRQNLEKAILEHKVTKEAPYPIYLECVLLEALRRYPVAGNMTVRTPHSPGLELKGGYEAPVATPLHIHMFSLQNTGREWFKGKEFIPQRWLETDDDDDEEESNPVKAVHRATMGPQVPTKLASPKCPFMAKSAPQEDAMYDGMGFREGSLSFFPFSVAGRACPGKAVSLAILRKFLWEVSSQFRLDPATPFWEDDCGVSQNSTIVPVFDKATLIKVRKISSLAELVASDAQGVKKSAGLEGEELDDGWAE